ncbi:DeoR/GlpR family DNA-binding transcription regulator [Aerococcaceae bacterium WGS1372]
MKQSINTKYQRHCLIKDRVNEEGKIYVTELAKELDVTPETLRRDLSELEEQNELMRIHGGAVPVERDATELEFSKKMVLKSEEKKQVARMAALEVKSDMTIGVDAGTSTMYLADMLEDINNLTVVTNSLAAAIRFNKAIEEGRVKGQVIVLPGTTNPYQSSIKGSYTVEFLKQFSMDLAFISLWRYDRESTLRLRLGRIIGIKSLYPDERSKYHLT